MKKLFLIAIVALASLSTQAKTLIVFYSYTNNIRTVINNLSSQIEADVLEVLPTEEGVKYEANNYAIGSALIQAIRNNPNDASSYPSIKTTISNLSEYNTIIIGTPLWWSNMAAPMQSFLFAYGNMMAGKNVGLIVSSASSGISTVESDARRLVPDAKWFSSSLHVRSSQTSNSATLISNWLTSINYNSVTAIEQVNSDATAESSLFYTLEGRQVTAPTKGVNIIRTKMSDGTYVTRKVINK